MQRFSGVSSSAAPGCVEKAVGSWAQTGPTVGGGLTRRGHA